MAKFLSPEFGAKFQREVPLFLKVPELYVPYNTVLDRWKEAPMPKNSQIRSTVSIEHRLVTDTDRQADRHRHGTIASTRASIASRGYNRSVHST